MTKLYLVAGLFSIYPSPAVNHINIATTDGPAIQVSDGMGKVHRVQFTNGKADISGLKPGVYRIRTMGKESKVQMGRFVKE